MLEHPTAALCSVCIFSITLLACGCADSPATSSPAPMLMQTSAPASQPAVAQSQVFDWNAMKGVGAASGENRQLLRSPTATLDELEIHITTLNPGQRSHPPHRHPHEEMMLLKEGALEALVNDQKIPMPTGSILFVAPNDLHNVTNVGTTPATYFVITWRTPKTAPAAAAPKAMP